MSVNSARNVVYPGEPLLGCNITKNMNMEEVTKVLAAAIEHVYTGQSLDGLELTKYGIACPPDDKTTLLAWLLELIMKEQISIGQRLTQINNFQNNTQQAVSTISDEKVKLTSDSTQSKFLSELISATVGKMKILNGKLVFSGFTPVGTRAFINPNRVNDFDASGKGKAGTDLEGWQIRNGQNGTDNALGRFIKTADVIGDTGKKAGNDKFIVKMSNIESFERSVEGTINEALTSPVTTKMRFGTPKKCFGVSGCRLVLIPDASDHVRESDPIDVRHSHSFSLRVKHNNPQPEAITIDPLHIKELPIEYIG